MLAVWIIIGAVGVAMLAGWLHGRRRRRRRRALMARRLTAGDRQRLAREVPLYARLPADHREKLEGIMQVFLDEMSFEACGGLEEVTELMRQVIAAQACMLLLESGYEDFGRLRSILVYPDAFTVRDDFGMEDMRLGESWDTGSVVLSWSGARAGGRNPEDGLNLVLHEFAHQIDQANGDADGLPILKRGSGVREWAESFGASYGELRERVERGKRTVLDDYGASNPAEFFAVATETFFEKPRQLRREHPRVYRELREFYGLDPLQWD